MEKRNRIVCGSLCYQDPGLFGQTLTGSLVLKALFNERFLKFRAQEIKILKARLDGFPKPKDQINLHILCKELVAILDKLDMKAIGTMESENGFSVSPFLSEIFRLGDQQ